MTTPEQPVWDPTDKSSSFLKWAEWLYKEAKRVFNQDGNHCHLLFLFDDNGIAGINPIPPNTESEQLVHVVRAAVKENNLYAVITVAESWTYFPKSSNDHTVFQIKDGEMRVADLNDDDKAEALIIRAENRDGAAWTWLNKIVRDGDKVGLAKGIKVGLESCVNWQGYFESLKS